MTAKTKFRAGDRVRHVRSGFDATVLGAVTQKDHTTQPNVLSKEWAIVEWDHTRAGMAPDIVRADDLVPVGFQRIHLDEPQPQPPPPADDRVYPVILAGDVVAPKESGKSAPSDRTYRVVNLHGEHAWCIPVRPPHNPITLRLEELQLVRRAVL